tara:strand:- start:2649 stop:3572 length:924 start_codon:yes stop_codon:yes gene_type:complete
VNNIKLKLSLLIVSFFYIFAFFILDEFEILSKIKKIDLFDFFVLFLLFFISIMLRYIRWYLILNSQGVNGEFFFGFLRYSSGFLYTATPGKVGELSRIYFYRNTAVKKENIVSAFIFERSFDLVVVLLLSTFILFNSGTFGYVAISISSFIFSLFFVCFFLEKVKFFSKSDNILIGFIFDVFILIKKNISVKISLISFLLGFFSWIITSYILIYLLYSLELIVDFHLEFISIYPLSMLVGALTFIPGGVGTTETTIVYILNSFNINIGDSILVAVLARFSTIWMATILGLFCSWVVSLKNIDIKNRK